ncbi:hypothetical protein ONZ45_g10346 [Pleurotus djamor]|nr:hypothetical protein ONZ45_g10346 [Pleurotus djamor]
MVRLLLQLFLDSLITEIYLESHDIQSVHSLPNEVWSEILKGYSAPDRRTLLPILSVSKRLYRLTVPLIYQSIFVIRIIEDTTDLELIKQFPCTPIYVHALSSLLSTLRARYPPLNLALGAHIKSFGWTSSTSFYFTESMMKTLTHLFTFFSHLQRLSVAAGSYTRTADLLQRLPPSVQLTHFELSSNGRGWSSADVQALLQCSPSLTVLSLPSRDECWEKESPLTLNEVLLPDVRELKIPPSMLSTFSPVFASAKVEGLTLDLRASVNTRELEDAFFTNLHSQERKVEAILNEKYWILENLRCLEVMFDQVQAQLSLMKVLGSLRCVEYVRVTAPIELNGRTKMDELLKIPSQNLKYILIGSKHTPSRYYFTAVALFEHFPSLVIVDFASHDSLVEPKKRSVVRFFRGRVRGFKMVRLEVCPPLEQWWEEVERMIKMETSGL